MPSSIRHGAAGRRAFVVDRQRAAALLDRAVVDDGDARRRDALADPAGEGRGALAVEIAFEPVADRFVEQHAGPAGAEHDRHLAGRRGDRLEVDQRLGQRDVDRAVPCRLVEQLVVEIAAAKAVIAGLAPAVLLGDDLDAEAHQRANVGGDEAVGADDVDHAPACRQADADLRRRADRGRGRRRRSSGRARPCRRTARGSADRRRRTSPGWCVRGGGAGVPFAGSSSFSVSAARPIAASLISLAWAKAVVSPETPRRPKPERAVVIGGLQPAVVEAEASLALYWR